MSQQPWSRLEIVGEYAAQTPLRIGSGAPDGSLALDGAGQPYIPAGTFRGALRAYLESALRGLDSRPAARLYTLNVTGGDGKAHPVVRRVALCCDSVDKNPDDADYQGCLTAAIVRRWQSDPAVRPILDQALIESTCPLCRLFGTPWLAGRVLVSDLTLVGSSWDQSFAPRSGITIARDSGVMVPGSGYLRQAIPAGTRFRLRLLVENASFPEQGMILMGLRAFESGLIPLGADRSRGLGQGRLEIDWWNCRYLDADSLIGSLLGDEPAGFTEVDAEQRLAALGDYLRERTGRPR